MRRLLEKAPRRAGQLRWCLFWVTYQRHRHPLGRPTHGRGRHTHRQRFSHSRGVSRLHHPRGQGTAGVSGVPEEELGYPHELWTTRLLAHHAREHGPVAGMRASATWRGARRRLEKIPALAALGRLGEHADLANSVSEEAREMASLIEDLVAAGNAAKALLLLLAAGWHHAAGRAV
jgi:hypothetical protein